MAISIGIPSAIPNGKMLIPMFGTEDINNNRHMDFLAFSKHAVSREVGIYDFVDENLVEIWSYTTPSTDLLVVGAAMGNFSGKNPHEILLLCSAERETYLLLIEDIEDPSSNKKLSLKKNINVVDIKAIKWGNQGQDAFVIIGGVPNRNLMIGRVKNQSLEIIQTIKNKTLSGSYGSIKVASGNIDRDKSNDLVVIINSNPSKIYQVRANGSFKPIVTTAPRVRYIPNRLFDIDDDGIDDVVFSTNNKLYYVNMLGTFSFPINDNLTSFFKSQDGLFAINSSGEIIKYSMEPFGLEPIHKSKSYFFSDKIDNIKSIFSSSFNYVVIAHRGSSSEIAVEDLDFTVNHQFQTLGGGTADVIATAESAYYLPIEPEKENNFLFSSMELDTIPDGMVFDIDRMRFDWTPLKSQLGFHSLYYRTTYKQAGKITQDSSKVSRRTVSTQDTINLLIYVNDPVKIIKKESSYTVVKNQDLKVKYKISDKNIDAVVSSRIVGSNMGASFTSYIDSVKNDIVPDSLIPDTTLLAVKIDSSAAVIDSLTIKTDSLSAPVDTTLADVATDSSLVNIVAAISDSTVTQDLYIEQLINHPSVIERFASFMWRPNVDPGSYTFTLATSDQITEDSLTLNVNVHPIIDLSNNDKIFTTTTNKEFSYLINVDQTPMSSSFTYYIAKGPENVNVDKNGKVYWIPSINQVDTNNISIVVYDEYAKSVYDFSVYVNDPPYITSLIPKMHTINTNDTINHQIKFLDFNSDQSHSWNIEEGPQGMTIDDEAVIKWIPNSIDYTDLVVSITDKVDTTFFSSTIYVNDIPKIISNPTDIVNVDEKFSYKVEVVDNNQAHHKNQEDDPQLKTSFLIKPDEMTISDDNIIEWIPDDSHLGLNNVQIVAEDGVDSDSQSFSIFVNSIPSLNLDDSLSIELGDTLLYNIQAEDLNQEDRVEVTYNGDLNIDIDNDSMSLRLVPSKNKVGVQAVELVASDGHPNSSDSQTMKVLLFTRPELVGLPSKEAFVGIQFSYNPVFIDMLGDEIDDDNIQLTQSSSKNMRLTKNPLSLDWIPDSSDVGIQSFEFEASDRHGVKTLKFFEVENYLNPSPQCEVERKKQNNKKTNKIVNEGNKYLKSLSETNSGSSEKPDSLQVEPTKIDSLNFNPTKSDTSSTNQ